MVTGQCWLFCWLFCWFTGWHSGWNPICTKFHVECILRINVMCDLFCTYPISLSPHRSKSRVQIKIGIQLSQCIHFPKDVRSIPFASYLFRFYSLKRLECIFCIMVDVSLWIALQKWLNFRWKITRECANKSTKHWCAAHICACAICFKLT